MEGLVTQRPFSQLAIQPTIVSAVVPLIQCEFLTALPQTANFLRFTHNRFSKRAIGQFEPFIRQKTSYLCKRFAQYKDSGQVLPINKAWDALTGDVVMEYAFGFNYNHLRSNDFGEAFHDSFMTVSDMTHVSLQFPWLIPVNIYSH